MYKLFKRYLSYIIITAVIALFFWNIYTITFYGYVTNWFWETYYEEEPAVFTLDLIGLILEGFLPIFIPLGFDVIELISNKYSKPSPVCPIKKAKRLRRKKRKNKRKS